MSIPTQRYAEQVAAPAEDHLSVEEVRSLNSKALELYRTDINSAEELAKTAERLANILNNECERAESLYIQGLCRQRRSEFAHSDFLFKEARRLFAKHHYQKGEASAVHALGITRGMLSDYSNALNFLQESLQTRKHIGDLKGVSSSCNGIGNIYMSLSDYSKALNYYEQSLAIRRQIGDNEGVAITLNNIGNIYQRQSDYLQALKYYEQSLAIQQSVNDQQGAALSLGNLGNIHARLSDYTKALDYYHRSLHLFQVVEDKHGAAMSMTDIGAIYDTQAEYGSALDYFQQGLDIRRQIGDKNGEANSLYRIGVTHFKLSNFATSLERFKQSALVYRETGDRYGLADALNGAGSVHSRLSEVTEAFNYYRESLDLRRELGDQRGVAVSLYNFGNLYILVSNYNDALAAYQESLLIREKIGDQHGMISSLNGIGTVYLNLSEYSQALHCYIESLNIARLVGDQVGEFFGLHNIAEVYFRAPNLVPKGKDEFVEIVDRLNEALQLSFKVQSKEFIYQIHEMLYKVYKHYGELQKALEHHEQFHATWQQVFNENQQKKLRNLQVVLQVEKAQKQAELERLKNIELANALNEAELQKARAEEANKLKSEFLGIAAHDLKNPLQSIIGFAQLLQLKPAEEKIMTYSQTIERAAGRMFNIITDLLSSVKNDVTQLVLKKQTTDVAELLAFVIQNNLMQAEQKQQRLEMNLEYDSFVELDAERMMEVFDNLVSNAVKYSPKGKTIHCTVSRQSASVKLDSPLAMPTILVSVKDEGQGLTDDDKKKLFGKFQRLSAVPTDGENSTGLGLSIVKQIVELHGGEVWAESEGKGKGSIFFVELPAFIGE
jgi:signal transduction histidine kinase